MVEQHMKLSLPSSSLVQVCLVMGDMKDGLGLCTDADQLWQQALVSSQQECWDLGLKEQQVSNPHAAHTVAVTLTWSAMHTVAVRLSCLQAFSSGKKITICKITVIHAEVMAKGIWL